MQQGGLGAGCARTPGTDRRVPAAEIGSRLPGGAQQTAAFREGIAFLEGSQGISGKLRSKAVRAAVLERRPRTSFAACPACSALPQVSTRVSCRSMLSISASEFSTWMQRTSLDAILSVCDVCSERRAERATAQHLLKRARAEGLKSRAVLRKPTRRPTDRQQPTATNSNQQQPTATNRSRAFAYHNRASERVAHLVRGAVKLPVDLELRDAVAPAEPR